MKNRHCQGAGMTTTIAKGQVTVLKPVREPVGDSPRQQGWLPPRRDGSAVLARRQEAAGKLLGCAAKPVKASARRRFCADAWRSVTLIDTNALLDRVTDDPHWAGWSIVQFETTSPESPGNQLCLVAADYTGYLRCLSALKKPVFAGESRRGGALAVIEKVHQ